MARIGILLGLLCAAAGVTFLYLYMERFEETGDGG